MNKTVLITNAFSEISKATAIYFAQKGWNVAIAMQNLANGKNLLKYQNVKVYQINSEQTECDDIIEQILLDFSQINVVLSFFIIDGLNLTDNTNIDFAKKQFQLNVFGFMKLTKAMTPYFRSHKGGSIVSIIPSENCKLLPFHSIYHSAYKAIQGFSEVMSVELMPFKIQFKLFELPLLKSDFYSDSEIEKMATKIKDNKEYFKDKNEFLLNLVQSSSSISEIPSQIYCSVQDDTILNGTKNEILPQKTAFSNLFRQTISRSIQKMQKKK
jgi:short-subunit dehydrogenase